MKKIIDPKSIVLDFMNKHGVMHLLISQYDTFLQVRVDGLIKMLSGFDGSNGVLLLSHDKMILFTDSRYTLQASQQCACQVINMSEYRPIDYILNTCTDGNLGILTDLHSYNFVKAIESKLSGIVTISMLSSEDLLLSHDKSLESDYFSFEQYVDVSKTEKVKNLFKVVKEDAIVISDLCSACWLLNIRGRDDEYNPICRVRLIIDRFSNIEVLKSDAELLIAISDWSKKYTNVNSIAIDGDTLSYDTVSKIMEYDINVKIIENVILEMKSIKTEKEVNGFRMAHLLDGVAMCKLLYWLDQSILEDKDITEADVVDRATAFRAEQSGFICPSFGTIAGFGKNAAVIHYQPNDDVSIIRGNDVLLIDSGGHYYYGTTDVTRTIAIGIPAYSIRKDFTIVLKCHIAMAMAIFPIGSTGDQLDVIARYNLWLHGKDYEHSTGHGIGHCLSVHEFPVAISRFSKTEIKPNMIFSNEPGYYVAGSHGIRIENVVLSKIHGDRYISLDTLTMVPIDKKMIIKSMLSEVEIEWINQYHKLVYTTISNLLSCDKHIKWLNEVTSDL